MITILYFPREPLAIRYNNEIFNKLREYQGFEISEYLDFHYNACIEKSKFLRFLQYETGERMELDLSTAIKSKLNFVLQLQRRKVMTAADISRRISYQYYS